jgi:hypothetical protein
LWQVSFRVYIKCSYVKSKSMSPSSLNVTNKTTVKLLLLEAIKKNAELTHGAQGRLQDHS